MLLPILHHGLTFVSYPPAQGALYKAFLTSDVVQSVLLEATEGKKNVLPALSVSTSNYLSTTVFSTAIERCWLHITGGPNLLLQPLLINS